MTKELVSLVDLIRYDNRSEFTKYLTGGQLEKLTQLVKTVDLSDIDDLEMSSLGKVTSDILAVESQALLQHVVADLEKATGLKFTSVADNRAVDFQTLAPGIYRNLYFYADLSYLEHQETTIFYCAPLFVKNTDGTSKIVLPQLTTEIKSDTAKLYKWMTVLFANANDLSVRQNPPDVDFLCVDYKIVTDANFEIDYKHVNTYNPNKTSALPTSVVDADDLRKEFKKAEVETKDHIFFDANENQISLAEIETKMQTLQSFDGDGWFFFEYFAADRVKNGKKPSVTKKRVICSPKTYTTIKRGIKTGVLNGELIGNSAEIYDDVPSFSKINLFNSYELAYIGENSLDQNRAIIKQKLAEMDDLLDYNDLAAFARQATAPIDTSWLNKKLPDRTDSDYDDFPLMQATYLTRVKKNFAYSVYQYSSTVISKPNKYWWFEILNKLKIKNEAEWIELAKNFRSWKIEDAKNWLKNDLKLRLIADEKDDKLITSLQGDAWKFVANQKANLTGTVYGDVYLFDQQTFANKVAELSRRKLVHFDFETISTYFNFIPGQVGKIQLVTQMSVVNTDEHGKMSDRLDLVFDPLKLNPQEDYKDLIDELYQRIVLDEAVGVVYNESFEKNRLLEMVNYLAEDVRDEYRMKVQTLNDNIIDLMRFYHGEEWSVVIPELHGYYSIKKLDGYPADKALNQALNTQLDVTSYQNLDINKGEIAQMATLERIVSRYQAESETAKDQKWQLITTQLKDYCHNDVTSMAKQFALLTLVAKQILDEKSVNKDLVGELNVFKVEPTAAKKTTAKRRVKA